MTAVDLDLLAGLMAAFEAGEGLDPDNPFGEHMALDALRVTEPFLEGNAIPETARYLPPGEHPHAIAFATAGLLQGLAIGYEYAKGAEA